MNDKEQAFKSLWGSSNELGDLGRHNGNGNTTTENGHSSGGDNYDSNNNTSRYSMVRHVPLIENIVMGKLETVIDEDHVPRKRSCLQSTCLDIENDYADAFQDYDHHYDKNDSCNNIKLIKRRILSVLYWLFTRIRLFYIHMDQRQRKRFFLVVSSIFFVTLSLHATMSSFSIKHLKKASKVHLSETESEEGFYRVTSGSSNHKSPLDPNFIGEKDKSDPLQSRPIFSGLHPPVGTSLPAAIENRLAEIDIPYRPYDVPMFWHIPRSGGATVKDVMGQCLGYILASDVGARDGRDKANALEVFEISGSRYVNVDTIHPEGIKRAKSLGLIHSELADAVVAVYVEETAELFDTNVHKGRLFTMFRHPIERVQSLFNYLSWAKWEETYDPSLAIMTLDEYAQTTRKEFNWMTRTLSGNLLDDLTEKDLDIAKSILKRKTLIGLWEEKEESFRRFESYL